MSIAVLPWLIALAGLLIAATGGVRGVAAAGRRDARLGRLSARGRPAIATPPRWATYCAHAAGTLGLARTPDLAAARLLLQRAGWRSPRAAEAYLLARIALPPLLGIAGLAYARLAGTDGAMLAVIVIASAAAGHFAPAVAVANATARRKTALTRALPDGVDLLVVCVEAGLGMNEAFRRVGRELTRAHAALAEEFQTTAAELSLLPDRAAALQNLHARTGLDRLRGLVSTLLQAERFGTPIAGALRVLAADERSRRTIAAEERAAKLPVLLTLPMMVFILPVLFIVLLGPAALGTLDTLGRM